MLRMTGQLPAQEIEADAVVLTVRAACRRGLDVFWPCVVDGFWEPGDADKLLKVLLDYYPADYGAILFRSNENGAFAKQEGTVSDLLSSELDETCALYLPAGELQAFTRHRPEALAMLIARLRGPGGCPWDAKQNHESLRDALLEETWEVLHAIRQGDDGALCEELGDLLLQIVFHGVIAQERGAFDLTDICSGIVNKLIYRHPHVFGMARVKDAGEVLVNWERLKKAEKGQDTQAAALRAVPESFPALLRSYKVQKRAADVGFDWDEPLGALDKVREEELEVRRAMEQGAGVEEELGDLLFSAVNACRLLHAKPEELLHRATEKFIDRFEKMEQLAQQNDMALENMTLAQMDELWNRIKTEIFL